MIKTFNIGYFRYNRTTDWIESDLYCLQPFLVRLLVHHVFVDRIVHRNNDYRVQISDTADFMAVLDRS